MGLFNKLKNLFYEEEIEEVNGSTNSAVKLEKKEEEENDIDKDDRLADVENIVSERELFNTEPTFKFPVIFEEEDLNGEKERNSFNVLEAQNRKFKEEAKKTLKEEAKPFKPSPIISPIYGVLDKNYKKEEITTKDGLLTTLHETEMKVDVDSVRKKAYGEVTTREERNISNIVEEGGEKEREEINLFPNKSEDNEEEASEYDLDEIDKKIKSIDDLLKETNDEDFYSLVDSMYKDEGEDE